MVQSLGSSETSSDSERARGVKYWLAVATEDNCSALAQIGYPFYALNWVPKVLCGDRCIFYRSGNRRGFIGAFEFVSGDLKDPIRLGDHRVFVTRLPLKPLVISDQDPVEIAPLIDKLEFITAKANYSMSLRNSFRSIPEADYLLVVREIKRRSKAKRKSRSHKNLPK